MNSSKEVDWSRAPEGATHYNEDCACSWLKETPASYFREDRGVWVEYSVPLLISVEEHFLNAVKRPQKWNSSGVPPIGTACEYFWTDGEEWRKCEVVAYYCAKVVAVDVLDSIAVCLPASSFHPIKTPEQIAAEERLRAINEMYETVMTGTSIRHGVEALYDAGYRKTEVKK